jgi:hypothetical protein
MADHTTATFINISHSVQCHTKLRLHLDFLVKIQGASNARPLQSQLFSGTGWTITDAALMRRNELRNN